MPPAASQRGEPPNACPPAAAVAACHHGANTPGFRSTSSFDFVSSSERRAPGDEVAGGQLHSARVLP